MREGDGKGGRGQDQQVDAINKLNFLEFKVGRGGGGEG